VHEALAPVVEDVRKALAESKRRRLISASMETEAKIVGR